MKLRHVALPLFLALAIAAAVLLPFSYDLLGRISIGDRIALFESDLNLADRSNVYLNFHPTLTADYGVITGDGQLFNTTFPYEYQPYTITIVSQSDPNNVTAEINAADPVWGGSYPISFKMAQQGEDWMIEELHFAGAAVLNIQ